MFRIANINNLPEPQKILSEKELEKYCSFKIEKRKKEYLAGRFAAKMAILDTSHKLQVTHKDSLLRGNELQTIEISYDHYGRPCWKDYLLSISHSGNYAVACAKNGNCNLLGIDIEKIEQRHPLWAKDYFHKTEVNSSSLRDKANAGTSEFLTELWTKKEAILKALGLGLKVDLLDIIIKDKIKFLNKALSRYKELGEPDFIIKTQKFENYIISLLEQIRD